MERREEFECEFCRRSVRRSDVIRRKTFADLDPTKWQTFCCPECGHRIKTVFVGLDEWLKAVQ